MPVRSKPAIQKHLNQIKGDSRTGGLAERALGPERPCPWWHEVSTYCFQSAFADVDRAWGNWLASLAGRRAGRKVGDPRFKKKGRSRDSFRLHHDVKKPAIRLAGYRREAPATPAGPPRESNPPAVPNPLQPRPQAGPAEHLIP